MKKILLKSTFLSLIFVTACQGDVSENPTLVSRPKRPLTPVDSLSFMLPEVSDPRPFQAFWGVPVGTCELNEEFPNHDSKKMCEYREDSDCVSSPSATGSTKDGISPTLPLPEEKEPPLAKLTSIEVDPKAAVPVSLHKPKSSKKKK